MDGIRMRIFVVLNGQEDNIGDVVLRRYHLQALTRLGEVHAFVPNVSDSFLSSLTQGATAVIYADRKAWMSNAMKSMLGNSGWLLSYNSGEFQCAYPSTRWFLPLSMVGRIAQLRGGKVVMAGLGTRDNKKPWKYLVKQAARAADYVSWRDALTPDMMRLGSQGIDWGFKRGDESLPLHNDERRTLALTFRFDRPLPSSAHLDAVKQFALHHGLKVVPFAQVRRDNQSAQALAEFFETAPLLWPDSTSHADQEVIVRSLFSRSALVLSDRLHALIVGTAEGAAPVGLVHGPDQKINRHFTLPFFEQHGLAQPSQNLDSMSPVRLMDHLAERLALKAVMPEVSRAASDRVDAMEREMAGAVRR
jgi:polysaccharide pyruvyl transferase WcaK-like protein